MSDICFDSDFVEKICQAQSWNTFNMEKELLENSKKQIEKHKDNWFILFQIPCMFKHHETSRSNVRKVVEQIVNMFKSYASPYVLCPETSDMYKVNVIPNGYDFKSDNSDTLKLGNANLFGLYFSSSPKPLGSYLSSHEVKQLL